MEKKTQKVSIIPQNGLGDALITAVLAQNLHKNHCQVTIYHKQLSKLASWFPQFTLLPAVTPDKLATIFKNSDFSISIQGAQHLDTLDDVYFQYKHKHAFLSMDSHTKPYDQVNDLTIEHPHAIWNHCLQHAGIDIHAYNRQGTVASNMRDYCEECLHLKNTQKQVDFVAQHNFSIPPNNKSHIIIHPESSQWRKNWPAKHFIKLADKLTQDGYEVTLTLSPSEYPSWRNMTPESIKVAQWGMLELAEQLNNCHFFIGNDSGPGHLASLLGTPTLTIYPRRIHPHRYVWNPGWAKGEFITPKKRFFKYRIRNHVCSILSVTRVYRKATEMLQQL